MNWLETFSKPIIINIGRIAQRSEQGTHNALVQGSNPCTPKIFGLVV